MTREIKNILRETINDLRNNNIGVLKANNYESTYFDLTPAKTDYASLKINSIVVYIIDGEAVVDVLYKIKNGNNSGQRIKKDKKGMYINIKNKKMYF